MPGSVSISYLWTAWPDEGMKKLPNFPQKIAPKVATYFLHNSDVIRNRPKSHQNIWAAFARVFVAKKL